MNVKEAVGLAKDCITDIFSGEEIVQVGLDEVEFDEEAHTWFVTIGFSRLWDAPTHMLAAIAQQAGPQKRSNKVVSIDDLTGIVKSVWNRGTKLWAESA